MHPTPGHSIKPAHYSQKYPNPLWGWDIFIAVTGEREPIAVQVPGGRLRMEKLANLVMAGRIHPEKLITHRFVGLENVEAALMLMKDKPRDLIKPLVLIEE